MSEQPEDGEEAFVVEEVDPTNSIATSDVPSKMHGETSSTQDTEEICKSEQLLWIEQNGCARKREVRRGYPPAVPHEDARSNQVVWLTKVICYLCYDRGHLAAD